MKHTSTHTQITEWETYESVTAVSLVCHHPTLQRQMIQLRLIMSKMNIGRDDDDDDDELLATVCWRVNVCV